MERLVTSHRVASHFSVAVNTVRRWARDGLIPCIRVSSRVVRFRIQDVERALHVTEKVNEPVATSSDGASDDE